MGEPDAAWRDDYRSWGDTLAARHRVSRPATTAMAAALVAASDPAPVLAYGCGRSYGDVALNPDGRLIDGRGLDRFIAFDRGTGVLRCEAGVRLTDILAVLCRPDSDGSGWLLPVMPGTRFVTIGGAIANDVHGKNHHLRGSFGCHVLAFDLARSDGQVLTCTPETNAALFAATIGGIGLTGLILRATIQLRRVAGTAVEAEDIRFDSLAEFFALAAESDAAWEYTAAWIDCLAHGDALGRGIFSRARHAPGHAAAPPATSPSRRFPLTPPVSLATPLTVRAFNALYWRKLGKARRVTRTGPYEAAFFPLDAVGQWNRIYGRPGFFQFQCAVPHGDAQATIAALLRATAESGQGSMLSVLKMFGDPPSPGLMSFPMPGATLALDFPNRGATTRRLLARLEQITVEAGGRIYPAKDAVMAARTFRGSYPAIDRFTPHIDPRFSSAFARRVALEPATVLNPMAMPSPTPLAEHPPMKTVALFGATSDIAAAVARRYAAEGCRLVLIGRDETALAASAADLGVRSAAPVATELGDFARLDDIPQLVAAVWERFGGLDIALIAYGSLPDQARCEQDAEAATAAMTLNFISPALLAGALANRFAAQGHGVIAVISSVAGDRGRRSNYVYGAAKGGLQRYLEGLRHRLAATGVAVLDIRPGFVSTKMTAHLNGSGPLWATPDAVAGDIVGAIKARRAVLYTPWFWRLIMLLIRALPRAIMHRTSI